MKHALKNWLMALVGSAVINLSAPAALYANQLNNNGLENKIQNSVIQLVQPPAKKPSFIKKYETNNKNSKQGARFDVLVNSEIYDSLENHLLQYAFDLENDSLLYNVTIYSCDVDSSQSDSVRNFLKQEYEQDSIGGAVFVGNFPHVMFQGMGRANNEIYQEFPSETFFRDVDGQWLDILMKTEDYTLVPGSDSIYDTHIDGDGSITTEIYIGRIDASNLNYGNDIFGGEISRLRSYFERNHAYRLRELASKDTTLIYFDDQWAHQIESAENELKQVYPNIIVVNDPNETNADDYKERLQQGYQWIWLTAHSGSCSHGFRANGQWGDIHSMDIPQLNPQTLFYFTNGCAAADFAEPWGNCIAQQCLFSSDKGLLYIGYSARAPPPSAFFDKGFFSTLGGGTNLGEALNAYLDKIIRDHGWGNYEAQKLVLLGDPTLKPRYGNCVGVEIAEENNTRGLEYIIRPNPVTKNATIIYTLPKTSDVNLRVYDALGRMVKVLEKANKESGTYYINWDASELSSGIYFVRFEAEGFNATRKLLIIR